MRVLLIENAPGLAIELEDRLTAAGHAVLTCYDESGGPCKGVTSGGECPVETDLDLAVLVQPSNSVPTLDEAGIVCARRRHVPVVRVESPQAEADLAEAGEIEHAAAQAARRNAAAYALAVDAALADVQGLSTVERTTRRVGVTVRVPHGQGEAVDRLRIADRARAAVRAYDPYVAVIDIAVVLTR